MLTLSREQILAYRRRAGGLDERLPFGPESLRRAAWAGLQDSMPRAALLSLHARIERIEPNALDHPSLAQLWGPRYSVYVVAQEDFALFSLGRYPEDTKGRERAERNAKLVRGALNGERMTDREVGRAIGVGNAMRYGTTTGTIAIRWEGARAPVIWAVPAPEITPSAAQQELARRYLHVFGPASASSFATWAGVSRRAAGATWARLAPELVTVRTPVGEASLLRVDEEDARGGPATAGPARLLPSGDAYYLLAGADRELLVPQADLRERLWTSRVWPGALLVDGEIVGTWRRAKHVVEAETWSGLSAASRDAVEREAASLPLSDETEIRVVWS
jgi:hypothetical protein